MARIDFAFGAPDRLRMACEVTRKHYLAGRDLVIYTQDKQRLARFDRLLWGFDATAFIPHVQADDPLAAQTAVLLTSAPPVPPAGKGGQLQAWLINLDLNCPPGAERFERVLEIVSNHDEDKQAARERWRQYKEAGHDLHAHDLSRKS
ncbi:DNA polymerase III subunit chi [Pollutimonas bauzanensis]|jgi:DNA polymerase-3 subunit chi|uniref:DNA polymerase III subunit chi n=1 Tax=Pollutimonas bauzanensis TaxID=658167 RepID=UPI003341E363